MKHLWIFYIYILLRDTTHLIILVTPVSTTPTLFKSTKLSVYTQLCYIYAFCIIFTINHSTDITLH